MNNDINNANIYYGDVKLYKRSVVDISESNPNIIIHSEQNKAAEPELDNSLEDILSPLEGIKQRWIEKKYITKDLEPVKTSNQDLPCFTPNLMKLIHQWLDQEVYIKWDAIPDLAYTIPMTIREILTLKHFPEDQEYPHLFGSIVHRLFLLDEFFLEQCFLNMQVPIEEIKLLIKELRKQPKFPPHDIDIRESSVGGNLDRSMIFVEHFFTKMKELPWYKQNREKIKGYFSERERVQIDKSGNDTDRYLKPFLLRTLFSKNNPVSNDFEGVFHVLRFNSDVAPNLQGYEVSNLPLELITAKEIVVRQAWRSALEIPLRPFLDPRLGPNSPLPPIGDFQWSGLLGLVFGQRELCDEKKARLSDWSLLLAQNTRGICTTKESNLQHIDTVFHFSNIYNSNYHSFFNDIKRNKEGESSIPLFNELLDDLKQGIYLSKESFADIASKAAESINRLIVTVFDKRLSTLLPLLFNASQRNRLYLPSDQFTYVWKKTIESLLKRSKHFERTPTLDAILEAQSPLHRTLLNGVYREEISAEVVVALVHVITFITLFSHKEARRNHPIQLKEHAGSWAILMGEHPHYLAMPFDPRAALDVICRHRLDPRIEELLQSLAKEMPFSRLKGLARGCALHEFASKQGLSFSELESFADRLLLSNQPSVSYLGIRFLSLAIALCQNQDKRFEITQKLLSVVPQVIDSIPDPDLLTPFIGDLQQLFGKNLDVTLLQKAAEKGLPRLAAWAQCLVESGHKAHLDLGLQLYQSADLDLGETGIKMMIKTTAQTDIGQALLLLSSHFDGGRLNIDAAFTSLISLVSTISRKKNGFVIHERQIKKIIFAIQRKVYLEESSERKSRFLESLINWKGVTLKIDLDVLNNLSEGLEQTLLSVKFVHDTLSKIKTKKISRDVKKAAIFNAEYSFIVGKLCSQYTGAGKYSEVFQCISLYKTDQDRAAAYSQLLAHLKVADFAQFLEIGIKISNLGPYFFNAVSNQLIDGLKSAKVKKGVDLEEMQKLLTFMQGSTLDSNQQATQQLKLVVDYLCTQCIAAKKYSETIGFIALYKIDNDKLEAYTYLLEHLKKTHFVKFLDIGTVISQMGANPCNLVFDQLIEALKDGVDVKNSQQLAGIKKLFTSIQEHSIDPKQKLTQQIYYDAARLSRGIVNLQTVNTLLGRIKAEEVEERALRELYRQSAHFIKNVDANQLKKSEVSTAIQTIWEKSQKVPAAIELLNTLSHLQKIRFTKHKPLAATLEEVCREYYKGSPTELAMLSQKVVSSKKKPGKLDNVRPQKTEVAVANKALEKSSLSKIELDEMVKRAANSSDAQDYLISYLLKQSSYEGFVTAFKIIFPVPAKGSSNKGNVNFALWSKFSESVGVSCPFDGKQALYYSMVGATLSEVLPSFPSKIEIPYLCSLVILESLFSGKVSKSDAKKRLDQDAENVCYRQAYRVVLGTFTQKIEENSPIDLFVINMLTIQLLISICHKKSLDRANFIISSWKACPSDELLGLTRLSSIAEVVDQISNSNDMEYSEKLIALSSMFNGHSEELKGPDEGEYPERVLEKIKLNIDAIGKAIYDIIDLWRQDGRIPEKIFCNQSILKLLANDWNVRAPREGRFSGQTFDKGGDQCEGSCFYKLIDVCVDLFKKDQRKAADSLLIVIDRVVADQTLVHISKKFVEDFACTFLKNLAEVGEVAHAKSVFYTLVLIRVINSEEKIKHLSNIIPCFERIENRAKRVDADGLVREIVDAVMVPLKEKSHFQIDQKAVDNPAFLSNLAVAWRLLLNSDYEALGPYLMNVMSHTSKQDARLVTKSWSAILGSIVNPSKSSLYVLKEGSKLSPDDKGELKKRLPEHFYTIITESIANPAHLAMLAAVWEIVSSQVSNGKYHIIYPISLDDAVQTLVNTGQIDDRLILPLLKYLWRSRGAWDEMAPKVESSHLSKMMTHSNQYVRYLAFRLYFRAASQRSVIQESRINGNRLLEALKLEMQNNASSLLCDIKKLFPDTSRLEKALNQMTAGDAAWFLTIAANCDEAFHPELVQQSHQIKSLATKEWSALACEVARWIAEIDISSGIDLVRRMRLNSPESEKLSLQVSQEIACVDLELDTSIDLHLAFSTGIRPEKKNVADALTKLETKWDHDQGLVTFLNVYLLDDLGTTNRAIDLLTDVGSKNTDGSHRVFLYWLFALKRIGDSGAPSLNSNLTGLLDLDRKQLQDKLCPGHDLTDRQWAIFFSQLVIAIASIDQTNISDAIREKLVRRLLAFYSVSEQQELLSYHVKTQIAAAQILSYGKDERLQIVSMDLLTDAFKCVSEVGQRLIQTPGDIDNTRKLGALCRAIDRKCLQKVMKRLNELAIDNKKYRGTLGNLYSLLGVLQIEIDALVKPANDLINAKRSESFSILNRLEIASTVMLRGLLEQYDAKRDCDFHQMFDALVADQSAIITAEDRGLLVTFWNKWINMLLNHPKKLWPHAMQCLLKASKSGWYKDHEAEFTRVKEMLTSRKL